MSTQCFLITLDCLTQPEYSLCEHLKMLVSTQNLLEYTRIFLCRHRDSNFALMVDRRFLCQVTMIMSMTSHDGMNTHNLLTKILLSFMEDNLHMLESPVFCLSEITCSMLKFHKSIDNTGQ